jgi:hypothetical protein
MVEEQGPLEGHEGKEGVLRGRSEAVIRSMFPSPRVCSSLNLSHTAQVVESAQEIALNVVIQCIKCFSACLEWKRWVSMPHETAAKSTSVRS